MHNLYLNLQVMLSEIDINVIKLSKDNEMLVILTSEYRFLVRHTDYESKLREFISVYDQFLLTQKPGKIKKNIDYKVSTTNYGENFISFIEYKKVFGAQFHPEKSHSCGLKLIKNFCNFE